VTAYLGLGSNLGDRKHHIHSAVEALRQSGITIEKISTIIETEPQGGPPQGRFLNAVCAARTELSPEDLLAHVKNIEKRLGRTPSVRNGPRTIDIDILFYDRLRLKTEQVTIPHPRIRQRPFILNPMREIAPAFLQEYLDEDH